MRCTLRRFRLAVLAAAVLTCLASQVGTALADPAPPQPTGDSPQSLRDGCQRDPAALLGGASPEWAYVYNTPPDQPPPPPQWVTGVASSFNPRFEAVHTAGADFAFGHDAYDFNLNVRTDPEYSFLKGGHPASGSDPATGNYAGNGEETDRLHTEWEDLTIPKFAWPEPGDTVTERGSWVWDCGHWGTPTNIFSPDYDLPHEGQPCPGPFAPDPSQCEVTGENTEFHPYRALFDERAQSSNSPYGESEAELYVSTDKTKAGKTEDCAHKFPPPPSAVLPNPAAYPPEFDACLETEPNWQDVSGDYSFLVHAPAQPTPDATLTYRAVDRGSVGAPVPTLTPEGNGVRVTFHLDSVLNQRLVLAYQIFVGWDTVPLASVPTHLRVTLDQLEVHRAMDPGCSLNQPAPGCDAQSTRTNQATTAPGDWNLYWDVNGIWGQWQPGELLTHDGDVLAGGQSVDLYVPPGKGWRLFVHGRECDINAVDPANPLADCPTNQELADNNDVPGLIDDTYSSADASLGTHRSNGQTQSVDPTSTCPDDVSGINPNPDGCYSLTYTVTKIDDQGERVRAPYPTPSRASLLSFPIVPNFRQTIDPSQCQARGGTPSAHGAPLALPSCDPPSFVPGTVAHIGPAGAGSSQLTALPGDLSTAANDADVAFGATLTDVRSGGAGGPDYDPSANGGDLAMVTKWQITDLYNGATLGDPATAADFDFPVPVQCAATADQSIGAACDVSTTANALVPGAIREATRAVIQVFRLRVNDAGSNGVLGDSDDRAFAQQGIYVP